MALSETPGAAAAAAAGDGRPPLEVGLLVSSTVVPRWAADVIEEILDAGFINPVLVVVSPRRAPGRAPASRARSAARHGLYRAYRSIDARLFRRHQDPFASVDLGRRLAELRRIAVPPDDARGVALQA